MVARTVRRRLRTGGIRINARLRLLEPSFLRCLTIPELRSILDTRYSILARISYRLYWGKKIYVTIIYIENKNEPQFDTDTLWCLNTSKSIPLDTALESVQKHKSIVKKKLDFNRTCHISVSFHNVTFLCVSE